MRNFAVPLILIGTTGLSVSSFASEVSIHTHTAEVNDCSTY